MFHTLYAREQQKQASQAESPYVPAWPPTYTGQKGLTNVTDFRRDWRLEAGGLVAEPLSLNLEELQAMPRETQNRRLISAAGWTYRSEWEGIPIQTLLERVKPLPEARYIKQSNLAGQVETLSISDLLQGRALFCLKERGNPLSPLYGGPLQLMVFDRYQYKGLGQLTRLEFTDSDAPGSWERLGYSHEGSIRPGDYYAFDLREKRYAEGGEINAY